MTARCRRCGARLPARYVALPSIAYRLALVAVGEGVATLSLTNPCSWDYAAGHALIRAAGGVLVQADGSPITYTCAGGGSVSAVSAAAGKR